MAPLEPLIKSHEHTQKDMIQRLVRWEKWCHGKVCGFSIEFCIYWAIWHRNVLTLRWVFLSRWICFCFGSGPSNGTMGFTRIETPIWNELNYLGISRQTSRMCFYTVIYHHKLEDEASSSLDKICAGLTKTHVTSLSACSTARSLPSSLSHKVSIAGFPNLNSWLNRITHRARV